MFDLATPQPAMLQGLIDMVYATVADRDDVAAMLTTLRAATGARALRLTREGRGDETILGSTGTDAADPDRAHDLRINGRFSDTGRRLVLHLAGAPVIDGPTAAMLLDLLGHLDRALALSDRLRAAEVERSLGSDLLDRLSIGTVYLAADRRVITLTGSAEALITSGDGLCLRGGLLTASCGTEDRTLQAAIRMALADPEAAITGALRIVQRRSNRALGLVVQPVTTAARSGKIACAIVIRDGERPCEPKIDMLRSLFDLTPAEATLTSIMSMGHTLDEAAEELAISRNTARAHLRAIFSKCGINRQTELVRLVLTSVAMLGNSAPRKAA